MKKYVNLLRIKHYIKNSLLFLPIVFGMKITDVRLDVRVLIAFCAFSLMSSVIYIMNDIKDIEKDRLHPQKKNRPIAKGDIGKLQAGIIAFVLFVGSVVLNYCALYNVKVKWLGWCCLASYFIINFIYSVCHGKFIPLLDVVLLVSGFIIRVYYGAVVSEIPVSIWMSLVICSGAFYMGFGKRRNELLKTAEKTRTVLKYYTESFLNQAMGCCMTLSITFYSLWILTQLEEGKRFWVVWSIPVLMIILFRYSMNVDNQMKESGGDPIEVILTDKVLMLLCIFFVGYIGICMYL